MVCDDLPPSECVMIGDNLEHDVIGAINYGLDAYLVTGSKQYDNTYKKINNINELKEIL